MKIATYRAAKSSTSSETTRRARRSVSMRSTKDSSGGRLRRTSTGGRTIGGATAAGVCAARSGGSWMCEGASATCGSASINAAGGRLYRDWVSGHGFVSSGPVRAARGRRGRSGAGRAREGFGAGFLQRAGEPLAELDLRLPAELLPRERDVGLADLRVVGRKRLVDDLRARAGDLDHLLGELEQRELVRVADVHREVQPRLRESDDAVDQIRHEAEGPGLGAVAEHGDRPVLQRLAHER